MLSLKRMFYAIKTAKKHKHAINKILKDPSSCAKDLCDINCSDLKKGNIKALVLDFDGVLASHGQIKLDKKTINWLKTALKIYPKTTYILSNNPKGRRFSWLNKNFPEIHLIAGIKKKPYPDGLNVIIKHAKVKSSEVVLVDDRLLTGVLASLNAKTKIIYITEPRENLFSVFFLQECFFATLRFLEKKILTK